MRNAPWKKLRSVVTNPWAGAVAIYSVFQVTGYAGSCIRVRRASDNTEQDIGFSAGVLSMAALATFRGASTLYLVKIYDQSGAGNHATQTDTTAQPVVITANAVGSLQPLTFDSTPTRYAGSPTYKWMDLPASLTLNRANFSVFRCVAQPFAISRSGHYEFDASSRLVYTYSESSLGVRSGDGTTVRNANRVAQLPRTQPWVLGETFSASQMAFYSGADVMTSGGRSATAITGGRIGATQIGGDYVGQFDLFAFVVFPTCLSSQDSAGVVSWLESSCAVTKTQTRQVVLFGNSRIEGYDATQLNNFARQLAADLSHPVRLMNMGIGGRTMATMSSSDITQFINPLVDASLSKNILLVGDPTNDFTDGTTAATCEGYVQSICTSGRSAGFAKIAVVTACKNGSHTSGQAAEQAAYNTWLRANYASFADGLVDFDADARFSTPNDGIYFSDSKHQTSLGQGVEATLAAAVIDPWL
jgi:hypothetical protein